MHDTGWRLGSGSGARACPAARMLRRRRAWAALAGRCYPEPCKQRRLQQHNAPAGPWPGSSGCPAAPGGWPPPAGQWGVAGGLSSRNTSSSGSSAGDGRACRAARSCVRAPPAYAPPRGFPTRLSPAPPAVVDSRNTWRQGQGQGGVGWGEGSAGEPLRSRSGSRCLECKLDGQPRAVRPAALCTH